MAYFVEGLIKDGGGAASQVERIGEYATLEDAIAASQRTIDDFLERQHEAGLSPTALFARYQAAGKIPFIFTDSGATLNVPFNHLEYAMRSAARVCERKSKGG